MGNVTDTAERSSIQETIEAGMHNNTAPRIELAIMSENASSVRDIVSVLSISDWREQICIPLISACERNNVVHELHLNVDLVPLRNVNSQQSENFLTSNHTLVTAAYWPNYLESRMKIWRSIDEKKKLGLENYPSLIT